MKRCVVVAALLAAASAGASPEGGVALRLLAAPAWRGVPTDAPDGSTGQFLYPAPTPLLGLVAVLTHSAVVNGARSIEEKRRLEESDRVLQPYASALVAWTPRALAESTLPHLASGSAHQVVENEGVATARWRVDATPSFSLPPEQDRLQLDSRLRVQDSAAGGGLPVEWQVRVLSPARLTASYPPDEEAAALKADAARLLAHSVNLALLVQALSPAALDALPYKTHRYQDGGRERMERSQLLSATCARLVLRTLRGTLLSVPARLSQVSAAAAEVSAASAPTPSASAAQAAASAPVADLSQPQPAAAPVCQAEPYDIKLVDALH